MFWTKEPAPSPVTAIPTCSVPCAGLDLGLGLGAGAGLGVGVGIGLEDNSGDVKHTLTLDTNIAAHTEIPAPFSDQLSHSHSKSSGTSQLDSPLSLSAELKNGEEKPLGQTPSPEAMFRSWDSYGAFPSGDPPHGLHTAGVKQMGMGMGLGLALDVDKNSLYDNIHDRSPVRNSVVWDSWKYGSGETQKSYQLP